MANFVGISLEIKASLALCKAMRFSVRILLVSEGVKAVGLSINMEGSFGLWPNTNWNGETPWVLANELFAFKHYDKAYLSLAVDLPESCLVYLL